MPGSSTAAARDQPHGVAGLDDDGALARERDNDGNLSKKRIVRCAHGRPSAGSDPILFQSKNKCWTDAWNPEARHLYWQPTRRPLVWVAQVNASSTGFRTRAAEGPHGYPEPRELLGPVFFTCKCKKVVNALKWNGILLIWSTKWSLFIKLFAWMDCKSRDESNEPT